MKAKEVLKELIKFDTINNREQGRIYEYLRRLLEKAGFVCEELGGNLIARRGNNPKLGFSGHIDTVEIANGWQTDPFELVEKDGKLQGLGACDMKGGIAAFVAAAIGSDKPLTLYFTRSEETTLDGIENLVKLEKQFPPLVVVAEPTDNIPVVATKGPLEMVITVRGKSVHSSDPDKGHNAIYDMAEIITEFRKLADALRGTKNLVFSVPFTTMNIGLIKGGKSFNSTPDECEIHMEFRTVDVKQKPLMLERIKQILKPYDAEVKLGLDIDLFDNKEDISDIEEISAPKTSENYFTEASFMSTSAIILGPGPITAHQANEYISVKSLEKSVDIFQKIIEKRG